MKKCGIARKSADKKKKISRGDMSKGCSSRVDEVEVRVEALEQEILKLQIQSCDQERTIDNLIVERDEVLDELHKVRLTLAEARNIRKLNNEDRIGAVSKRLNNGTNYNNENQNNQTLQKKQIYAYASKDQSIQTDTVTSEKRASRHFQTRLSLHQSKPLYNMESQGIAIINDLGFC